MGFLTKNLSEGILRSLNSFFLLPLPSPFPFRSLSLSFVHIFNYWKKPSLKNDTHTQMGTTPNYDTLRLLPLCPESWVWAEQGIRLLLRSLRIKDCKGAFRNTLPFVPTCLCKSLGGVTWSWATKIKYCKKLKAEADRRLQLPPQAPVSTSMLIAIHHDGPNAKC